MNETEQIRADVWATVQHLTDEQINQHAETGKWNVAQVLEHLYLIERMIVKYISISLVKSELSTTNAKPFNLTLDRSRSIEAPPHLVPSEAFMKLEDLKTKLNESRQSLLQVTQGISENELTQKSFPHPVLGMMDLKQWVTFVGVHEQRHLEQIKDVLRGSV